MATQDQKVYFKNGCNPPLLIVKEHPTDASAVYVVPASLPWAGSQLVRRDQLHERHYQDTDALYIVRLWDGFDGEWMDVSEPLSKAEADKLCGDKNEARMGSAAGKRTGSYSDIDYYKVFPADTKMMFSEGRSQTR